MDALSPLEARRKLEALSQMAGSEALLGVASLLKRVKNISKGVAAPGSVAHGDALKEPAEIALARRDRRGRTRHRTAAARGDYRQAFTGIAALRPAVTTFFDDVMVMTEDAALREARLRLVATSARSDSRDCGYFGNGRRDRRRRIGRLR